VDAMGETEPGLDLRAHWQAVYAQQEPEQMSWYEPTPAASLAWIEAAGLPTDAAILDAGGGTSALAAALVRRGYGDITVADISAAAIERGKAELGGAADRITWLVADLRSHAFERRYDLWHDRAAFHFMVDDEDRDSYLGVMRAAIRPAGHLILATFGPEGPTECSGLPTRRYGADELVDLLSDSFRPLGTRLVEHRTPSGSKQQFLFAHLRRGE